MFLLARCRVQSKTRFSGVRLLQFRLGILAPQTLQVRNVLPHLSLNGTGTTAPQVIGLVSQRFLLVQLLGAQTFL